MGLSLDVPEKHCNSSLMGAFFGHEKTKAEATELRFGIYLEDYEMQVGSHLTHLLIHNLSYCRTSIQVISWHMANNNNSHVVIAREPINVPTLMLCQEHVLTCMKFICKVS